MTDRVENIERRMTSVEQILPTLATKADLAGLRTALEADWKADFEAAIRPLATRAEMKAEAVETRRHFDVVAESLRADIRLVAEGLLGLRSHVDVRFDAFTGELHEHDRRLTRLEASPPKRRRR